MKAKFIKQREPNQEEKNKGAEVVFDYQDENKNTISIMGATCHESWEQWGAPREFLSLNVDRIEAWRRKQ